MLEPGLTKSLIGLATVSTDNAVVKFIGTTGNTQNSGVIVDASNNVSGVAALTVAGTLAPSTNNTRTNGTAALQWSDVRSVLGNFTGAVTATGGSITATGTGNSRIIIDTTAAGVAVPGFEFKSGGTTFWELGLFGGTLDKRLFVYDSVGAANVLEIASGAGGAITLSRPVSVAGQLAPTTNNTRTLGTAALQWSDVRSVLGNFSGNITGGNAIFSLPAAASARIGARAPTGYDSQFEWTEMGVNDRGVMGFAAGSTTWQLRVNGAFDFVTGTQAMTATDARVAIPLATASTTTATGALVVSGGVGVAGALNVGGALSSSGATAGIGYATGAGGVVTQATSKSTGVTLNRVAGQITLNAAALAAATSVSLTLTNSAIAATDVVFVSIASGASVDAYTVTVTATAAGSCRIQLRNESAGSLSEALVLNFAIIKAVAA